jgi:hypothetical protein
MTLNREISYGDYIKGKQGIFSLKIKTGELFSSLVDRRRSMREGDVKPFNESNVDLAPTAGGIYAIYDETAWDEPAYIGRSNNIQRRLKEHLSGRGSKSIAMLLSHGHELWFSFGYSNNPHGAEAAELSRLSPAGNRKREIKALED